MAADAAVVMGELAGTMRERVAVVAARTRDAAGAATGDPVVGEAVWAFMETERPAPGVEAGRLAAPARYRIVMRAVTVINVGDRLRWRGQSLAVLAVLRDPTKPDRVELRAEVRP